MCLLVKIDSGEKKMMDLSGLED